MTVFVGIIIAAVLIFAVYNFCKMRKNEKTVKDLQEKIDQLDPDHKQ